MQIQIRAAGGLNSSLLGLLSCLIGQADDGGRLESSKQLQIALDHNDASDAGPVANPIGSATNNNIVSRHSLLHEDGRSLKHRYILSPMPPIRSLGTS